MPKETNIIKEEEKEIIIGNEKWTIHMKGIKRLTKEDPTDAFAKAFGFIKIKKDEEVL